ncbi:hypothetical protein FSARC_3580 [Fusarium sarcochroum]|uniref:Uncharacterized protein n=1 Tax=Fusarium sarcochroum TaxID=1208366 RepID=A0A8H4U461_9HYPO|nr:hypothetical protein FSARC_3580 [Fusarium sarcochroum]
MLNNLPREIIEEIFSYFCLHCRNVFKSPNGVGTIYQHNGPHPRLKADEKSWYSIDRHALYSLTLTCKKLHPIAENVLYHEFAPGYGCAAWSDLYTFEGRLTSFMRTVGRRKDLAAKVRVLFIHRWLPASQSTEDTVESLRQGAADLGVDIVTGWQRRASRARHGKDQEWFTGPNNSRSIYLDTMSSAFTTNITDLRARHPDWRNLWTRFNHELIPMLIALLPNVEHITFRNMSFWHAFEDDPFEALGITRLPNLRSLETSADDFLIIDKAINLEVLNLSCLSPWSNSGPAYQAAKIRTIRLAGARHLPTNISSPLTFAAKDLRSFVYQAVQENCSWDWMMSSPTFNAEEVVELLKDYRETLETLHLDFRGAIRTPSDPPLYSRNFSLRDFTRLSDVFLSTGILFDVSNSLNENVTSDEIISDSITRRMPSSIVSLHLASDGARIQDTERGLIGLADTKKRHLDRFPCLQNIGSDFDGRLHKLVHRAMEEAEISLVYENWPREDEAK